MNNNPLWEAWRLSGKSQEEISEACHLSRPTISAATWKAGLLPPVKWGTIQAVAKYFGYKAVITLEPIEESGNGK